MPDIANKFIAVAITQDEARVWTTGLEKGTPPEKIKAPHDNTRHHHVRMAQHNGGHDVDPEETRYFAALCGAIAPASEILLIGHGNGKANAMVRFVQYLERKHPDVAHKVVDAIDSNLQALTEDQILAQARNWFDNHHRTGL
ncbi:unannotated protein [freshwater metagenome]|uniref:Unannotated protein n=1 Tax=freshwater metagenome TaxID=449393 RepID=A0A6J7XUG1_9ZZZZ|nr:hypothetical protein [Actinomycetota bacterium]